MAMNIISQIWAHAIVAVAGQLQTVVDIKALL